MAASATSATATAAAVTIAATITVKEEAIAEIMQDMHLTCLRLKQTVVVSRHHPSYHLFNVDRLLQKSAGPMMEEEKEEE